MRLNYKPLGKYIQLVVGRNNELGNLPLVGLSIQKKFIPSIANTIGTDMSTYRIIERNQFAYGPVTSRNGNKITIALFNDFDKALISQAYIPFEVKDQNELDPEYLMMWFRRSEFDRYARFKSHGSAREIFDWEEMCNTLLPVPNIDKQREIVNEYNTIQNRITLNQQLIQKLEETAQAIYREWFVEGIDLENLPEGWRMGKLEELVEITSGKAVVSRSDFRNDYYQFPIYGAGGIMGFTHETLYSEKLLSIGRVGTHGLVQRINFPCWLSDNTLIFKSHFYNYVYQILLNVNYDEINRGGVQGLITQTDMKNLNVVIPKSQILTEFELSSGKIFELQDLKNAENQKLTELKALLLSRLATVEN
jgi:type I restriction enzyme S subunit